MKTHCKMGKRHKSIFPGTTKSFALLAIDYYILDETFVGPLGNDKREDPFSPGFCGGLGSLDGKLRLQ